MHEGNRTERRFTGRRGVDGDAQPVIRSDRECVAGANTIYYARPGSAEVRIADGRSPMMAVTGAETYIIWQAGTSIRLRTMAGSRETIVGEGRAPQVLALRDGHVITAWENAGTVYVRRF